MLMVVSFEPERLSTQETDEPGKYYTLPQSQSRQPCSAHLPQVWMSRFFNVLRARWRRTAAEFAVTPEVFARSCTLASSRSTFLIASAYSGLMVFTSALTHLQTSRSSVSASTFSRRIASAP